MKERKKGRKKERKKDRKKERKKDINENKTGLQPVSIPLEQVPLLRALGVSQSPISAMAKQTDRLD